MVRDYGYYSNVCRGNWQQENRDNETPCIIEPDETSPARRKAWARLIQKLYEVDPPTSPKCKGAKKIINFIDQPEIIKAILQHVGLWGFEKRPPPKTKAPTSEYYSDEQIPSYDCADPDYPFEAYI
jgi:hypothetical protein